MHSVSSNKKPTRAIFLDRDGILNDLVLNPLTSQFEAPHKLNEVKVVHNVASILIKLQEAGFHLFIVSNQPDYALGKSDLESTKQIATFIKSELERHSVVIQKDYYCYHHPKAVVADLAVACECRKPKTGMLMTAAQEYNIDLTKSWMIGDQDSDVECGTTAGCRTVLVLNPHSQNKRESSKPTLTAKNLSEGITLLLEKENSDA